MIFMVASPTPVTKTGCLKDCVLPSMKAARSLVKHVLSICTKDLYHVRISMHLFSVQLGRDSVTVGSCAGASQCRTTSVLIACL